MDLISVLTVLSSAYRSAVIQYGVFVSIFFHFTFFEIHTYCRLYQYIISFITVFHCMAIPQFIYPFTSWQTFGSIQFGAIMNKATINDTHVWTYVFVSLGQIPRSGIAWLHGQCINNFIKCTCTILYFHQQWMTVLVAPHPCHLTLHFNFLHFNRWCGTWLWFAFPQLADDVDHCFTCLSLIFLLWQSVCSNLLPIYYLLLSCKLFKYFVYKQFYKHILPVCSFFFHFLIM